MHIRGLILGVALATVAGATAAAPDSLPVRYSLSSPLYGSGDLVVRLHQTQSLTYARVMAADGGDLHERVQAGELNLAANNSYIAGDRTGGRLGKFQNMGRPVYQISDGAGLETGKRYPDPDSDGVEWRVSDLDVSLQRGNGDRTVAGLEAQHYVLRVSYRHERFEPGSDDPRTERIESRRDFWFARSLPFSPAQLLPLQLANSRFVTYGPDRIQDGIYARVADRMRAAGMLVRTALDHRGKAVTVTVEDLAGAPALDLAALNDAPLVPESVADAAIGPLFMSRMMADRMPEGGQGSLTFSRTDGGDPLDVTGRSAYTVADSGDTAIVQTFRTEDGARGMFMLMRPHLGKPSAGTYGTAERLHRAALEAMPTDRLRARANDFQALGVLEDERGLTVFTSAVDGEVVLMPGEGEGLTGRLSLTMESLSAFDGTIGQQQVVGSFESVPGLEMRMRSPTSRLLD